MVTIAAVEGGVWIIGSSFEERARPKSAGAWWHPGLGCGRERCAACRAGIGKSWWTREKIVASRLLADGANADDATRATLSAVEQARQASRAVDADVTIPVPEGRALLPFQRAGVAYMMARPRTLLADDPGLGKTIQALGLVNVTPEIGRVLVVCPATLRLNWRREAERWLTRPTDYVIVEDDAPFIPADGKPIMVIANYERVRRPACLARLMAHEWDLLIIDEAHRLKDPKTAQTKSCLGIEKRRTVEAVPGLSARAKRLLLLTGTPLVNRPVELWPLAHACDPETFQSFWSYAKRFCAAVEGKYGWDLSGASNLDTLQDLLRTGCMIRRLKRDCLTELPAKRRQVIEMEPNGCSSHVERERKAWASREEESERLRADADLAHASGDRVAYDAAVNRLRDGMRLAFEEIARARHDLAVAKAPRVAEHVIGLLDETPGARVVVMAHHHDVVKVLTEDLAEYGPVVLTGETPQADRQGIVDRFQTDPGCRVFIGSITAAGVGITLTAASTMVFAELDWTPGNMTQAEDRIHRIGQGEQVLIQHLVIDGSLDAQMAKTLVAKQAVADAALDDIRSAISAEPVTPGPAREPRPSQYPVATPEQRTAAKAAMQFLRARCDGASTLDGAGFSKIDARMGHSLAEIAGELTDGQVWLSSRLARKYRRQLDAATVEILKPLLAGGVA